MSVYQPLADFLAHRKGDRWEATFGEIETTIGRTLPQSAYRHQAWWANQSGAGHSQTHGWRSAGWRTARLDLERHRVTFERVAAPIQADANSERASLIATAMHLSGMTDPDAVIVQALRLLVAREAARTLVDLGGSMPDYRTPARERP